jgi:acyl-CoA synthetase (AMP-forming)/AMP-acid ligase II
MSIIFSRIKKNSIKYPSKLAIVDGDHIIAYSELIERVELITKLIKNIDSSENIRIAICVNEGIHLPILVLALNLIKATIIPINPALNNKQIQHLLACVEADYIILDELTKSIVNKINLKISKIKIKELLDIELIKLTNDTKTIKEEIKKKRKDYDQFLITSSSGSTGNPKPIIFSEEVKIARFEQAVQSYQISEQDVVLCASPFYHSLGQRLTLLPLLAGGTLCILKDFTVENWVNVVTKNKVSFTIPVSSHLHELNDFLLKKPFKFPSLRCIVSSSAAINDQVKSKLFEELPCEFHEMYGASEVATVTNLNKIQAKSKPKSVGNPNIGVHIKIVNNNMEECMPNTIGQIIVKSPLASSGYYGLPHISLESFKNGYFITGDIGYLDEDGFLFFIDRLKDIIISGGINIYPSDIEEVLNKTFGVKGSYVVGISDAFLGEIPVAVIVSAEEPKSLEKLLRKIARDQLAGYQRPVKYFFRNNVPLTSSGKINKRQLRNELNLLKLELSSKLLALYKSRES